MLLDDTARCAGTLQPLRATVLGLCLGCAAYTLRPTTRGALAYLQHEPGYTPAWRCEARQPTPVPQPRAEGV